MEVREGYKQTEIGVIPSDWNVKSLGDIGECIIGLTYSPNDVRDYGTLVLRSSNVQNNKLAFENNVFVKMELPERVFVKENDILICVRNGSKHLIGKCALIDKSTENSAFGAFMAIYRTKYSGTVFYQFQSNIIQKQIDENLGATINQITNKDLASYKIPLPPTLKEQTAIATALSDTDAWINSLEHLLTKKCQIKQGSMQELLQPKEGWEVNIIGKVFNFKQGVQCAINEQKFENNKGFKRFIRIVDLTQVSELPRYISDPGIAHHIKKTDLFMVRYGNPGLLGYGYEGVIANNLFRLIPLIKIESDFFFHLLCSKNEEILQLSSSTTMAALNFTSLKNLILSFPKDINEQTRIATILSDMDEEIGQLESKLEKAKQLKQGMMQELLTGRIRLV